MTTRQDPTYERETITAGASTDNPWRGLIVDVAGTVTIQNTERDAGPVVVPVVPGINPHVFNSMTAVSGPTVVVAYR